MELQQITTLIYELGNKYKDNSYMMNRLETYLYNLPSMLEQENKRYNERISRFNELTLEQDNFHKVFLSKHQYFYMPYNNIYYEYDGKTYKIVKEDDIHYNLLSTITDEGKLIKWKHKTKQTILKNIKERSLLKSTPETYTIQNVFAFLQTMFHTKSEAKYFLTVIGDCVLKKNSENLQYFVSSTTINLISLIDSICYVTTGKSIMDNFITKYHYNHKLSSYRLINNNVNTFSYDIVKNTLNNIGLDLLCVAAHYSDRYTNADNYLKTKTDTDIKNAVLYFEQNSQEKIIDNFCNQCIETVSIDSNINWKNMHYIWKLYLTSINIPNMIYSSQLQTILSNKLGNSNENGSIIFTHVTSKYLPYVSSYLLFWEKYITITVDNNLDDEYEVDEIMTLYKNLEQDYFPISESNVIKMICHYFSPQVEVIDNKYITNIKCNLWSKQDDINEFLNSYKSSYVIVNETELISIDDLYQSYKSYYKAKGTIDKKNYLIVSKHFFEKFLINQLANYIHFDKFVSSDWLNYA
jgi:hypothetical protein